MVCGACQLGFSNDEFLKCSGVCEKSFHGKLACSGVKVDLAKLITKNKHVQYVCDDCRKAKLHHVR